MNKLRTLATGALFLFFLIPACGSEGPSGPTGQWNLDAGDFAEKMSDALIEMGNAEAGQRPQLVNKLKSTKFVLDIRDDGTFAAKQSILGQKHDYKGTWDLTGGTLTLDQTHENGKEVADQLVGPFKNGSLTLVEEEDGVRVELKMLRSAAAAPR